MITIAKNLTKSVRYFSAYGDALKNIPTVDSKIIWLNCQDGSGNWHRITSYEGDSLLKAVTRACIPIPSSCQGNQQVFSLVERPIEPYTESPQCRECHVVILLKNLIL